MGKVIWRFVSLLLLALFCAQPAFAQVTGSELSTGQCRISEGAGSPEGLVNGHVCDIYRDKNTGGLVWHKLTGADTTTGWVTLGTPVGEALTRTNDANVLLTLTGTPATALLEAVNIEAGWSGQLSLARGGTNAALTAALGQTVVSSATALQLTTGGTTGQLLRYNGTGAVAGWTTPVYPNAAGTAGTFIRSNPPNFETSTLVLPNASSVNRIPFATAANVWGDNANLIFTPGTALLGVTGQVEASGYMGTPGFVSRTIGWRCDSLGACDMRYLFVDEMHAEIFIADLEQALAGGQIIAKSVTALQSTFTAPAAGAFSTITVKDLPSAPDMQVFQSGDIVLVKTFNRSAGSLTISMACGTVTLPDTTGAGFQTWRFTRLSPIGPTSDGGAMTAGATVEADSIVLDFGVSGNGYYEVSAIDGIYGINSPYAQIVTWIDSPCNPGKRTLRTRFGNERGVTAVANEFGIIAGTYAATNGQYLRATNVAFELHGIDISLWDNTAKVFEVARGTDAPRLGIGNPPPTAISQAGIFLGWNTTSNLAQLSAYSNANNFLLFDGTSLSWKGANTELTAAGNFIAVNATLSGNVTAFTGNIANFALATNTISATNLVLTSGAANVANIAVGTGVNTCGLNSPASASDIGFWCGATFANRVTAPTWITAAGVVKFSSGTIAGFAIENNQLASHREQPVGVDNITLVMRGDVPGSSFVQMTGGTSGTTNRMGSSTVTSGVAYSAGNTDPTLSPFRVLFNGSMFVQNLTVVSGVTFSGFTDGFLTVTSGTVGVASGTPGSGSTSITTVGTITTGTWHAAVIQPQWGGTGISSTSIGSILSWNTGTAMAITPPGAAGSMLRSLGAGFAPAYSTVTWPNDAAVGEFLKATAANVFDSVAGSALTTGTADANLVITLGGTFATALVNPASITLSWAGTLPATRLNANVVQAITNDTNIQGVITSQILDLNWAGTLALGRGGTGASLGAAAGALVYSGATALAIGLPGTTGALARSGGAGAPTWTVAAYPNNAGAAGTFIRSIDPTNFGVSTLVLPNAAVAQSLCFASAANVIACDDPDLQFTGITLLPTSISVTNNAAVGGTLSVTGTSTFGDTVFFTADANPAINYTSNLGEINVKYLTVHAAELWVETLVAQNTIATIGGRILVGPTTTLVEDLPAQLPTPTAPVITRIGSAGTTTYQYRVTARDVFGETLVSPIGSITTGVATLSGSNFNRITYTAIPGATSYRIYGRTGTQLLIATDTTCCTFDDTGAITPAGAQPAANTTSTSITVKHNQMAVGDRAYMEAGGKLEWFGIATGPTGAGPYVYTVTRTLDPTGSNEWYAGDAMFNTGQTGDGFIDLYSLAGVLSGFGPTIVGNVRTGTAYNAIDARWAIGNLRNQFNYGAADIYGAAFGVASDVSVTIDAENGFRILDNGVLKLQAAINGDLNLTGNLVMGTAGAIQTAGMTWTGGTGYWLDYNAGTPRFRVGTPTGDRVQWDGSSLSIASAGLVINSTGIVLQPNSGGYTSAGTFRFDVVGDSGLVGLSGWVVPSSLRRATVNAISNTSAAIAESRLWAQNVVWNRHAEVFAQASNGEPQIRLNVVDNAISDFGFFTMTPTEINISQTRVRAYEGYSSTLGAPTFVLTTSGNSTAIHTFVANEPGRYEFAAWLTNANEYMAFATVMNDGFYARIVANNTPWITLTLDSTPNAPNQAVRVTQTSGFNNNVQFSWIRIY
jgi:hypothetical protein